MLCHSSLRTESTRWELIFAPEGSQRGLLNESAFKERSSNFSSDLPIELAFPRETSHEKTSISYPDVQTSQGNSVHRLSHDIDKIFEDFPPAWCTHDSHAVKCTDMQTRSRSRGRSSRRRSRTGTPLSSSHGLQRSGVWSLHTVRGPLRTRPTMVQGPFGVLIALVFAVATLAAAAKSMLFTSSDHHQKYCSKCNGYGVHICDLCNGRGQVEWEGKLRHRDPCPCCFGSRYRKCSACGRW